MPWRSFLFGSIVSAGDGAHLRSFVRSSRAVEARAVAGQKEAEEKRFIHR